MIHASTVVPSRLTHALDHGDLWLDETNGHMYRYASIGGTWHHGATFHGPRPYAIKINNKTFNFDGSTMADICKKYIISNAFDLTLDDTEYARFLLRWA